MADPELRDPSHPEPAPDATLRLPAGVPIDPNSTLQLEIPKHLTSHSTLKLHLPEAATDPNQTQRLVLSKGDEPPIRVQKVDQPLETEGQTGESPLRPEGPKPFGWKLPLGLAALVLVGAVTYLVVAKKPSQPAGRPPIPGGISSGPEAVPAAAVVYLQQAKTGDAHAMRMLGVMYYYGLNVPQDRQKGLDWYRKAAEKGSDAARSELNKIEGGR